MAHQLTRRGRDRSQRATPRCNGESASEISPHHLIHGKLQPPQSASTCIERPALVARLDAAAKQKLILLTAPAGSGKTTLLAQWYRQACGVQAIAWLSLDEHDNEPVRFFSYLIAAFKNVCPSFDAYIPHQTVDTESLDAVVEVMITSLGRLNTPVCVVLDELSLLNTTTLLRAVDDLLLQSPASVRWILAGRGMPALHMSQLRLNDQLSTFGPADLNFDTTAIVQLGERLCHRQLTQDEALSIQRSTEGWVAGVKLALLAAVDSREGIGDFNGSHYEVAR
ncbi:AAA family ATPase, partial [Steroidobacter sp.]|uniref:AAA family ATPase n=1 Tax=Steroidobacter sp. TaxID=1978227 RepID=UPI001A4EB4D9